MFTSAGLIVALCLWLFGLGLLELFELASRSDVRRRSLLERHGVALLLGLSLLPAIYMMVAIAGVGPVPYATGRNLSWVCGGLGLVLYARGVFVRARAGQWREDLARTTTTWRELRRSRLRFGLVTAGLAATLFFCGFCVFFAGSLPIHLFDSLYHFAYKGKVLFGEGFHGSAWMVPSPDLLLGRGADGFDSVGRLMTHPNYPPGIPSLHCLVSSHFERFFEDATRPLMALYVLGFAAILWSWLSVRSLGAAVAGTLSWVSLPFLYYSRTWYSFLTTPPEVSESAYFSTWSIDFGDLGRSLVASWMGRRTALTERAVFPDGWTLDGSADLPQAVLFGVGLLLAWRCLRWSSQRSDRADALAAGVILGGCALVKNEGLALIAIGALSMGIFWAIGALRPNPLASTGRSHLRGLADGALAFGIAAAIASPWLAIRGEIPSIDEDYPVAIKVMLGLEEAAPDTPAAQPRSVGQALERVPIVLGGFGTSFIHVLRWNLVWVLFLATVLTWLVLRGRRLFQHPHAPLLMAIFGALGAYALILVVTPWDLPKLFSTAIPGRIILHVVPLVLFSTIALMWRRADEWNGVATTPESTLAPEASTHDASGDDSPNGRSSGDDSRSESVAGPSAPRSTAVE
jgi:hypothetical protein